MHQNQSVALYRRQRKIDFGAERLWPSLSESCRMECRKLITQLLVEVSHREREQQEGGVDERED